VLPSRVISYLEVLASDKHSSLFRFLNFSVRFHRAALILFLNKKDAFAEKVKIRPLENYFPSYRGGDNYEVRLFKYIK
jgi:hypothetical protein